MPLESEEEFSGTTMIQFPELQKELAIINSVRHQALLSYYGSNNSRAAKT
jgi:hypothetical protein